MGLLVSCLQSQVSRSRSKQDHAGVTTAFHCRNYLSKLWRYSIQYAAPPRARFIWKLWQMLFQTSIASILWGILILSEQDCAQRDKSWASTADVQIRTPPLIKQRGYCQKESEPSKRSKFMCNIRATGQKNNFVLASTPQQTDFP